MGGEEAEGEEEEEEEISFTSHPAVLMETGVEVTESVRGKGLLFKFKTLHGHQQIDFRLIRDEQRCASQFFCLMFAKSPESQ